MLGEGGARAGVLRGEPIDSVVTDKSERQQRHGSLGKLRPRLPVR